MEFTISLCVKRLRHRAIIYSEDRVQRWVQNMTHYYGIMALLIHSSNFMYQCNKQAVLLGGCVSVTMWITIFTIGLQLSWTVFISEISKCFVETLNCVSVSVRSTKLQNSQSTQEYSRCTGGNTGTVTLYWYIVEGQENLQCRKSNRVYDILAMTSVWRASQNNMSCFHKMYTLTFSTTLRPQRVCSTFKTTYSLWVQTQTLSQPIYN